MSNGLAIAAVTAIFKNLLEDGLVQNAALSSMGNVLVTTLPPDRISVGGGRSASAKSVSLPSFTKP